MARTILGKIADQNNNPISGARVEAYDEDVGNDDLMGIAYTDNSGNYTIVYRDGHWDDAPHDWTVWRPDIYIRVFLSEDGEWFEAYPRSRVYEDWKLRKDLTINLHVDDQRRLIEGRLVHKNGTPARNFTVRAMDQDDFNKNDFMGETKTDADGRYRIRYRGGHWDDAPHWITTWRPDIYVVAFIAARDGLLSRCFKSNVHEDWKLRDKLTVNGQLEDDEWVGQNTRFDPVNNGWPFDNRTFVVCAAPTCKEEHWLSPIFRNFLRFDWALCGGMSLSAVRRFNRSQQPEAFSPRVKEELVRCQLATLLPDPPHPGHWYTFIEWQARPDYPHTLALHTIGHMTMLEWPKLRNHIDRGEPRVIGLIRVGPTNDPAATSGNHQVLAIGYRLNKLTNEVELKVYDPNYHHKTSIIHFNMELQRNQINGTQKTPGESDERVRGFFLLDVPHN